MKYHKKFRMPTEFTKNIARSKFLTTREPAFVCQGRDGRVHVSGNLSYVPEQEYMESPFHDVCREPIYEGDVIIKKGNTASFVVRYEMNGAWVVEMEDTDVLCLLKMDEFIKSAEWVKVVWMGAS